MKAKSGKKILNGDKHCVTFEPVVWRKLQEIAQNNGMTISYVINELVKNVDTCENTTIFTFKTNSKDESNIRMD